MKGQNKIVLNEATMIAALEHYFETIVFAEGVCPKIEEIQQEWKADKWVFNVLIRERTEGELT